MPSKEESTVKHAGGRPLKYPTSEELEKMYEEYKKERTKKDLPYTKQSFFVYAGFYDANALKTYTNDKNNSEFSRTIKKMEAEVLSSKMDFAYEKPNAFSIFDLKVNHKWIEEKVVVIKDETGLLDRMKIAKDRLNES